MVQVLSSLMDISGSKLEQMDVDGTTSLGLVETINSFTSLARLAPLSNNLEISSPNIALDIRIVDRGTASTSSSMKFAPAIQQRSELQVSESNQVTIEVPQEAIQKVPSREPIRLQFVYFKNAKLFRDRRRTLPNRNMAVLSASLANVSVSNLRSAVRYTLPFQRQSTFTPTCVYWDSNALQWLSTGVKTGCCNDDLVICESSHLTAFSVLLDPQPNHGISRDHVAILTAISYFGALLSITGLMLTVITYSIFRCLNRDRSGKILLNLCISLLLMNISFLMISVKKHIDMYMYKVDTCMVVAMLSHYFVLTSLSWMLVEAINMYQLVITVFATSETRFIIKRMLFAWGVPLSLVAGTVYYTGVEYYRFLDPDWCLFSPSSITIYYLTFVGPATFVLTANIVVFLMVTRVLCQRRLINKNGVQNDDGVTAAQVRGAFTVMTLLGVTWIFGVFATGEWRLLFQYLFSVANSLQGFIIFMVRCVQYPEARRAWGRFLRTGELKSHRGGKNRGTSSRNTSSSSQIRGPGTIKGDVAWGGLRSRGNPYRMRDMRTEIVRPRCSASFTLPRSSQVTQPISRSRSLHLEDNSSKEGEDTSWRYMAPNAPPATTDQGYGTAEHSPESPRQQPRHLSSSPPVIGNGPGPSNMASPFPPSDDTTTEPTTSPISSTPTPTPTFTPLPSCYDVNVWCQTSFVPEDLHLTAKHAHCEELL